MLHFERILRRTRFIFHYNYGVNDEKMASLIFLVKNLKAKYCIKKSKFFSSPIFAHDPQNRRHNSWCLVQVMRMSVAALIKPEDVVSNPTANHIFHIFFKYSLHILIFQ